MFFWVRMRFVFARQQHVHMLNHKKATINNQQNAARPSPTRFAASTSEEAEILWPGFKKFTFVCVQKVHRV